MAGVTVAQSCEAPPVNMLTKMVCGHWGGVHNRRWTGTTIRNLRAEDSWSLGDIIVQSDGVTSGGYVRKQLAENSLGSRGR